MKGCLNPIVCKEKAAKWKVKQEKYAPIGQLEKDSFIEKHGVKEIIISNHVDNSNQYDENKRSLYRAVGINSIFEVIIDGYVIERSVSKDGRIFLNTHYSIKVGKGIYRPLNVILEYGKTPGGKPFIVVITVYSPNEMPWKWDEQMNKVCFC